MKRNKWERQYVLMTDGVYRTRIWKNEEVWGYARNDKEAREIIKNQKEG